MSNKTDITIRCAASMCAIDNSLVVNSLVDNSLVDNSLKGFVLLDAFIVSSNATWNPISVSVYLSIKREISNI
jgi:hypothetical protein